MSDCSPFTRILQVAGESSHAHMQSSVEHWPERIGIAGHRHDLTAAEK
jgi:hypothetical protein